MAVVEEAQQVAAQKEELEKQIEEEKAGMDKTRAEFDSQIADYENQVKDWSSQIESIKDEYDQAQRIIADSKNAEVQAKAVAEEIILDAEKRSVFLKEAALTESAKGEYLKQIKDKDQKIEEMEMEKAELDKKIKALEDSIATLEKKAQSGAFGGAAAGPKEYSVEVVNHNGSSEVDTDGINEVLKKKSADGWTLVSIINDDGGKIQSSLQGNDTSGGSLSVGAYVSKEDRVVMIFERPKKK